MPETKFGLNQLNNKTPRWAKQGFYLATAAIGVFTFIVSGDPAIPSPTTVRIMLYLKALDMFLLALSKMFGSEEAIKPEIESTDSETVSDVIGDGTRPPKGPK